MTPRHARPTPASRLSRVGARASSCTGRPWQAVPGGRRRVTIVGCPPTTAPTTALTTDLSPSVPSPPCARPGGGVDRSACAATTRCTTTATSRPTCGSPSCTGGPQQTSRRCRGRCTTAARRSARERGSMLPVACSTVRGPSTTQARYATAVACRGRCARLAPTRGARRGGVQLWVARRSSPGSCSSCGPQATVPSARSVPCPRCSALRPSRRCYGTGCAGADQLGRWSSRPTAAQAGTVPETGRPPGTRSVRRAGVRGGHRRHDRSRQPAPVCRHRRQHRRPAHRRAARVGENRSVQPSSVLTSTTSRVGSVRVKTRKGARSSRPTSDPLQPSKMPEA